MMLAGLRSRWTSPARCAAPTPLGDLQELVQDVATRPGGGGQPALEAGTLDVLEREEVAAVLRGALVVDLDDVGVGQPGEGLSLALDADQRARRVVRDDLEGHRALESGIERPVDPAERALAELLLDLVAAHLGKSRPLAEQALTQVVDLLGLDLGAMRAEVDGRRGHRGSPRGCTGEGNDGRDGSPTPSGVRSGG